MDVGRPSSAFKEILHLDMCGLEWIWIFQGQILLEIAPSTALCKVPDSTGGSAYFSCSLT